MKLKWAIAASLLVLGATAQAAGWVAALKNTPAEAFDDEDLRMFLSAGAQALNAEGPSPEAVTWSNPATGSGGRFQVISDFQSKQGLSCKRVRFAVSAKGWSEKTAVWPACRDAEGRWRLGDYVHNAPARRH